MSDLINGRTPEEIKAALSICNTVGGKCRDCPYNEKCVDHPPEVDALAYIERLEAKQPKWISVDDRLPKFDENVVIRIRRNPGVVYYAVATRDETLGSGWNTNDEDFNSHWGDPKVTHWMPLHELLEEENEC